MGCSGPDDAGTQGQEPDGSDAETGARGESATTENAPARARPIDDGCPPPNPFGGRFFFELDGHHRSSPAAGQCTVEAIAPSRQSGKSTVITLRCDPDASDFQQKITLGIQSPSWPFGVGDALSLETTRRISDPDSLQHSLVVRNDVGEMVLGLFVGWDPSFDSAAPTVFAPFAFSLTEKLCGVCASEESGCWVRAAIDVTWGAASTRVYDSTSSIVGGESPYTLYVHSASRSDGCGFDCVPAQATFLIVRES